MKRKYLFATLIGIMSVIAVNNQPLAKIQKPTFESWNGAAAARYGIKYAEEPNPMYDLFGSDCTNFASQCLYAGNKTMDSNGKNEPKKNGNIIQTSSTWYYFGDAKKYVCTTSWLRCSGKNNFSNYWDAYRVGTFSTLANVRKNSRLGDVIQVVDKKGTSVHSLVVTKVSKDEIYLSAHTSNRCNISLSRFSEMASNSWAGCKYAVFHFHD
ncbi:MAG: amidase domain-containing protein [Agathobacter sp.]|uniref:amidase domain-containing protein n=1 Tax=Agathobacter sp. TaxID=2021311 RepID=UPI0025839050|nr:amidase domain-containing protein [Agathobacter sp.]MCR5678336.1 amidase domain-containing protein [Agathobacter sp.]